MKKILFGITGLTLGGAERVLVDIVNKLCEKYEITIFTIYAKGELEKQLDKRIRLKSLYNVSYLELPKLKRKFIAPLKILMLKKYIYQKYIKENYDVEIAFLEGPITRLFSVQNDRTTKIVWIHNDITKVFGDGVKAKIKKVLDRKIYSKYQKLVFVSKDNLKKFNQIYKDKSIIEKEKKVIYNYIEAKNVIEKSKEKAEIDFNNLKINFVTVARLVPQKAIDRLIRVQNKLIKKIGYNQNFYVIGDGPERENLQKMINQYNLEESFFLLGKKENPYPYIKNADYFCLLSSFEGYGMVLEEAKILNKNIIITNTAAREAVEGYEKAIIIENNEKEIEEKLEEIIKNPETEKKNQQEEYDNLNSINEIIKLIDK